MKYIILANTDNIEPFKTPRQLIEFKGEALIKRTIRLLKENGAKDIMVTSRDPRFDDLGAVRYEPLYNDWIPKEDKGYWLTAFPSELFGEPTTYLLGDCYYSEQAIKTIIDTPTDSTLFFCTYKNKDPHYIKHHDEPLAFKVVDFDLFKKHIDILIDLKNQGKTRREPIMWELYRSINGIQFQTHKIGDNCVIINDESCDIDTPKDVELLELRLGGKDMVKVEAIEDFTLQAFDELKNIVRKNKNSRGHLYKEDVFECTEEMAKYLTGDNEKNKVVVKVLEVIPALEKEEVKPEETPVVKEKPKATKKKKTKK